VTAVADRCAAEPAPFITHEIVLRLVRHDIGLSCTCLAVPRAGRPALEFIAVRSCFPAADVRAAYRAWHADRGIGVPP
jgi:hypothetical protein